MDLISLARVIFCISDHQLSEWNEKHCKKVVRQPSSNQNKLMILFFLWATMNHVDFKKAFNKIQHARKQWWPGYTVK